MQLKDLAEVFFGIDIIKTHLVKETTDKDVANLCFLKQSDLKENEIVINDSSSFISTRTLRKFYTNEKIEKIELDYNDILININTFSFFTFKEFEYKVVPSADFLILRPSSAYLIDYFNKSIYKIYVIEELKKALELNNNKQIDAIENIDIVENLSKIEEIVNEGLREDRKKIDIDKINIKQGVMTLDKLLRRFDYEEIIIPKFQRKADLWTLDIKSRFIEALIVKQPTPAFYFDATNDSKWLVIDGLQRLTTIRSFVKYNNFVLSDLNYLPDEDFKDKSFDELPRWAQRNIEEYQIIAYIIEQPTPDAVKYKIFKSINESSLTFNAQEMRHSLNQGKPAEWVEELAEIPIFKTIMPLTEKEKSRMEDREYALRYLAFRITTYDKYKAPMSDFLDDTMTNLYKLEVNDFQKYKTEFGEALFAIDKIFGENAFKRTMIGDLNNDNFTQILYEIWVHNFAIITDKQREKLIQRKSIVVQASKQLIKNTAFAESIKNDKAYNKSNLIMRYKTVEDLLKQLAK